MSSYAAMLASLSEGHAEVPDDWGQGRTLFGGAVVALGVRAIRIESSTERPLRSLLVDFAGPVAPGTCDVTATVVRHGRSTTHAQATIAQTDSIRCVLLATLGADRESTVRLEAARRPDAPGPEELTAFPYLPGVTPTFTRHFDYRYASGGLPFSGGTNSRLSGWVRFREPPIGAGLDEQILALVDAWPSPTLQMMSKVAPASSMTWSLDLVPGALGEIDPSGWWFFDSGATVAAHGHARIESTLWSPDGAAAAFSTQTVAMFS
jgi:acyl-CoA thioesterase